MNENDNPPTASLGIPQEGWRHPEFGTRRIRSGEGRALLSLRAARDVPGAKATRVGKGRREWGNRDVPLPKEFTRQRKMIRNLIGTFCRGLAIVEFLQDGAAKPNSL